MWTKKNKTKQKYYIHIMKNIPSSNWMKQMKIWNKEIQEK